MNGIELILIALALSLDAFAVSVAASAAGHAGTRRAVFRLAFHFGLFQALMPILGWCAGTTLQPLLEPWDHWIAFVLLLIIGLHMLHAASTLTPADERRDASRGVALMALATATSIDALAVGLTLAMLRVSIWTPVAVIGLVTAAVSLLGISLGARLQSSFGRRAEYLAGSVLILIGLRILASHTLR